MVSADLAVFLAHLAHNFPEVRVPQNYVEAAREKIRAMRDKDARFAAAGYSKLEVTCDLSKFPRIGEALE